MPAKYSHVKKRTASGLLKKEKSGPNGFQIIKEKRHHARPNPHIDRSISQAMSAVAQLEHAIARILLIRFEQDIARLYSTRLYSVAVVHLPPFVLRCVTLGGPGWLAYNHDSEEIKDFFRAAIGMDLRQAGERVATKSVLWSYTALREFATSNDVPICAKLGLHSLRLLPYFPSLKAHLDSLEAMSPPIFSQPPHLGNLEERKETLEHACELKFVWANEIIPIHPDWDGDWREKVRYGYEKLSQTLWKVAREFHVPGYGTVLREKLTTKWCDCGCSTDHLGEVCERTVREDEEESGRRSGKGREWDGRGSGIYGWETEDEEDIWEIDLDFGGPDPDECPDGLNSDMTISEIMEWRFLKAEKQKDQGNAAFRKGDFLGAVDLYEEARQTEGELPHNQLNLAAAHLKLNNWIEADRACTQALQQHRSSKGLYRRAKARKMLGREKEATQDLYAVLRLQPSNKEALLELASFLPPFDDGSGASADSSNNPNPSTSSSSSSTQRPSAANSDAETLRSRLGVPKPKPIKQPPFPKTRADERKLKITLLSGSEGFDSNGNASNGKDGLQSAMNGNGQTPATGSRHGKERAGTKKSKGMMEIEKMRPECLSYPGWDRYGVKRVD